MKRASAFRVALVTAPNRKVARRLAALALKSKAAACANLIAGVEAHYWWKGKLESASEILILFKTVEEQLPRLEKLVLENHPYETPEFLVTSIVGGSKGYLEWLGQSLGPVKPLHQRQRSEFPA